MSITAQLSIDEILVDNKYGVAAVMSPKRIIRKPEVAESIDLSASEEPEFNKTQFIIPKPLTEADTETARSAAKKAFTGQIDESPEVFYTIPFQYKNYHHWGESFRSSDHAKKIIDQAAENALEKLSERSNVDIENKEKNRERHSIAEAIELAATAATQSIENVIFTHKKSPIILIHGFRGAPLGLKSIQTELKKANYKVYCPEIPPFAGAKMESYTPRGYANYLANFITENQITKPILIGHSMGSIVAAATAMHCPELINEQLILMSPISTKTPRAVAAISPLQNYLPNKFISYATTRFLAVGEDRETFKQTINITNQCSLNQPPSHAELAYATKFSTHYAVSDFVFKKNTLLLAGEKDRLIRASDTAKLAEQIGAQTNFLPNTGHLHNYEKPVETAQAILQFLKN